MAAFDLPSGDVRDAALKAFMANDVMVLSSGHRSARFRPPLNLSMDEAAEGIRRMEKALQELAYWDSEPSQRRRMPRDRLQLPSSPRAAVASAPPRVR